MRSSAALEANATEKAVYSPASGGHGVAGDSEKNSNRWNAVSAIAVTGVCEP